MKKVVLAALLMASVAGFSQEPIEPTKKADKREQFTPAQRTELRVKEMTLELDLNATQQKDLTKLFTEQETKLDKAKAEAKANREKGIKPTKDEAFAKRSASTTNSSKNGRRTSRPKSRTRLKTDPDELTNVLSIRSKKSLPV